MTAALLLLALVWQLVAGPRPDPELTPGLHRALSRDTICSTRWGLDRRAVTDDMKRHVFRAYDIPWSDRGAYEVDHLLPRSLGGSDDILNLWPQPWAGEWGARKKDRLEVALGRMYCRGEITLETAQGVFTDDWIAGYQRYVRSGR